MSVQPDADGGLDYLEKKLGIFIQGPSQTRRNAALDILTGRVPDERLLAAEAVKPPASHPVPPAPTGIHPSGTTRTPRAFRLASDALPAVDWASRSSVSPWLAASDVHRPRIRIERQTAPPPSRWPLVRGLLLGAAMLSVCGVMAFGVRSVSEPVVVSQPVGVSEPVTLSEPAPAAEIVVSAPIPTTPPSSPTPAPASVLRVLLDERYTSYRLAASEVGQFVAVGIPGTHALGDTVVTGWFHKVGGPPGGGYGLILRDQSPEARDGRNQLGRYYVFEVGDRGEVGVWLRDGDHWLDLLTWTPSNAVKPGFASNELTVTAAGDHMSFVVNGIPVASQTDTALRSGAAGLFVGGDGNQVAVERIAVSSSR